MNRFSLRQARPEDLADIARLFRDTVRTVNCRDYSPPQIEAWSGRWRSLTQRQAFCGNCTRWWPCRTAF